MRNEFINTGDGWVFRVYETSTFRKSYETAAWYCTIEVQAGDYPVTFTKLGGGKVDTLDDAYYANAVLPGRRTYDYFPSLFAGNLIGGGDIGERDEPDTFHVQSYAFSLRNKVDAA
jgi:hypothetical protein